MDQGQIQINEAAKWFFFSGGPGAPRYGDDPTKHAVDHDSEAFVREVLQNANDQGLPNGDPVEVTFRFVTLTGDEKEEFLDGLGWDDGLVIEPMFAWPVTDVTTLRAVLSMELRGQTTEVELIFTGRPR